MNDPYSLMCIFMCLVPMALLGGGFWLGRFTTKHSVKLQSPVAVEDKLQRKIGYGSANRPVQVPFKKE